MTLYVGDVREGLRQFAANGVRAQTCVTSPPYWGLRDYGTAQWDGGDPECDHSGVRREGSDDDTFRVSKQATSAGSSRDPVRLDCRLCGARRIDRQIGLEPTFAEYVQTMVEVFRLVRDVLADDGTLWLNLGDAYASSSAGAAYGWTNGKTSARDEQTIAAYAHANFGLPPKNLCGIPWRVAFALQDDGWYLRSDIIWAKPNPMPESVTDRPTKAHEYLFLLSKRERYYYDADAIAEPAAAGARRFNGGHTGNGDRQDNGRSDASELAERNRRTVWSIATEPYADAHFATFPTALVEPCIAAGTSERGHCPQCGKGWERMSDVAYVDAHRGMVGNQIKRTSDEQVPQARPGRENDKRLNKISTTTGWQPSCDCGLDPIPGVVLDPFMGSGTVAQVAQQLGRRWIGCELNPDYAAMIRRRTAQQGLTLMAAD